MSSLDQNEACQEIRYLKDKLGCQNEQICQLKEKLVTFDELVNNNNELKTKFDKFKQWVEDITKKENKMKNDNLNNLELYKQKLIESKLNESKLQSENKKLIEDIECMQKNINTYKNNEQKHSTEIEDLEEHKTRIINDLCNAKAELEEKCGLIVCLRNQLKHKESKYYTIECQLNECRMTCCRLREESTYMKSELEHKKTELSTVKSHATQTEQKLKLEIDVLSKEADAERKKVHAIEIDYNEANRTITNDNVKIRKLDSLISELREASEKDRCDMNNKIQRYQKEICAKDEFISNMKNQVVDLQQENECLGSQINNLKKQLSDIECKLKTLTDQTNRKIEELEKEKKSMCCNLQEKIKKIVELESEVCELKDKCKELEHQNCALQKKIEESEGQVCTLNDKIKCLEEQVCSLEEQNKDLLARASSSNTNCSSGTACDTCKSPVPTCQSSMQQSPQSPSISSFKKGCNNKSQTNDLFNELKQLYCGLQEVRQSARKCMTE